MEKFGIRKVQLKRLRLPGGMRKRSQKPHVQGLASSIERVGLLHPPMVRKSDKKLIYGCDRIAALMASNEEEVEALMVECTDKEAEELALMENAHRRHDPPERERMLALLKQYEEEERTKIDSLPKQSGRKPSAKARARKRIAEKYKITPDAVRKAEERQQEREKPGGKQLGGFVSFGLDLKEEFYAEMVVITRYVRDAQAHFSQSQRALTSLVDSNTTVPLAALNRIKEQLQQTYQLLNALKPYGLCPYCKGIDPYQDGCAACQTTGWVSKTTWDQCPEELLNEETPVINDRGTLKPLSSVLEPEEETTEPFSELTTDEPDELEDVWA